MERREVLLSFQTGFNLVSSAVVCAVLESIILAQVLEACDCLKLLSAYFDLCADATGVVCHHLCLLGTDFHAVGCGGLVETLNLFCQFFLLSCQILLQIVVRTVITAYLPTWASSAWMLSTPAGFIFVNDSTATSTALRRMGRLSSVSVWGQFGTDGSPLVL